MELFDLSGKVAIITGSTLGIGKAIAERYAEHGAKVVISSRKLDACNIVAAEINAKYPDTAIAIPCNISDKQALQNLVDTTLERWGQIDTLICNAAINPYYGSSADMPDDVFDKIMATNVKSNHWLAHMVLPQMVKRKEGSIIIVSSVGGMIGSTTIGTYCISKAADFQLARNLACEFGPHNIRVNCIAPGVIKTKFARALWENPGIHDLVVSQAPLRRIGKPDEIAGAAVFLGSNAGAYMTGQQIVIDGGVMAS